MNKKISLLIGFGIFAMFTNGLLLTYLWEWFVVPITHLPNLSFAQAIGVGSFAAWFKEVPIKNKLEQLTDKELLRWLLKYSIDMPIINFVIGYVVSLFV